MYSVALELCCVPPPSMKNCLHVHFKGLGFIKGSVGLGWKLPCWFKRSAPSLFLPEPSFNDDICSNHWAMSQLMLSATSKVPRSHADIFSKKQRKERRDWLPGLLVSGRRRNRLTLPVFFLFKPWRIQGGLHGCSVPLTSCGDWARAEIDFIYKCMYVHGKVMRETR